MSETEPPISPTSQEALKATTELHKQIDLTGQQTGAPTSILVSSLSILL